MQCSPPVIETTPEMAIKLILMIAELVNELTGFYNGCGMISS